MSLPGTEPIAKINMQMENVGIVKMDVVDVGLNSTAEEAYKVLTEDKNIGSSWPMLQFIGGLIQQGNPKKNIWQIASFELRCPLYYCWNCKELKTLSKIG